MNRPSVRQSMFRMLRLVVGALWFALLAAIVSRATEGAFLTVLLIVCGGELGLGVLGLAWLTSWAQRRESRPGQFQLGSLFLLTVYVAVFAAAVRWVGRRAIETEGNWVVLPIGAFCLLAAVISVPIVLGMLDALLRFAVWCLRTRPGKRLVRHLRRH